METKKFKMDKEKRHHTYIKYRNILIQDKLPVGEFECQDLDLHFQDISVIISHLDDFTEVFKSSFRKDQVIVKLTELIVGFGLVGKFNSQERELNAKDFPWTAQSAEACFKSLEVILSNFEILGNSSKRHIFQNILLLCATHYKLFPWSNKSTVSLSTDFMAKLLTLSNHKNLCGLLSDENYHPTIFKGILKKIRPALMKNTWLQYPSSCYIFSWFLHHVQHPYLSDYLCDIFPPPCMFITDHLTDHRVLAIQCFLHILDNVPPTVMKLNGKEDVIWNFLLPYIYSTEEKIIETLSLCMLKLPSFRSQKLSEIGWSKYDEALNQLLMRAEMEFSVKIKQIYLSHIEAFLKMIPSFKHLKRVMKIIEESFSKDTDVMCCIISLKILREIIKSCWPSMKNYCFHILKAVVILLYELNNKKGQENIKNIHLVYELCEDCLKNLKSSCPIEFEGIVSNYVEDSDDKPGIKMFEFVLKNS